MKRMSRLTVPLRNTTKRSNRAMGKMAKAIAAFPLPARRSITFDRGSEIVTRPHLQAESGTRSWFCDPQSPVERGSWRTTTAGYPFPAPQDRHRHPRRHRPHERNTSEVPKREDNSRGLRSEDDGDRRPTTLLSQSGKVALRVALTIRGTAAEVRSRSTPNDRVAVGPADAAIRR